eukprot:TRINITY_DN55203_c0_g1_i1.p1 TRINITY_DN55203_c0_g1~~TRINITY_DN55203_c0_g1_i1.p1  ORF type:complete len:473 (-),score=44.95 TRINITY_DN55203_c0_g1_i1:66-1484(-)
MTSASIPVRCGGMPGSVKKFYMLSVFVWATAFQALTWAPIAAAPDAAKHDFPVLTDADILMQLNWAPILQIALIPLAVAVLSGSKGLKSCVTFGTLLSAACALLRLAALWMPAEARQTAVARWLLYAAGMLNGASAAFLQGAPSAFSATWFPPSQRARATGCAFVGLGLGQALCYALCPLLVRRVDQLCNMLMFQMALGVPPVVCCLLYFPARPDPVDQLGDDVLLHVAHDTSSLVGLRQNAQGNICDEALASPGAFDQASSWWREALKIALQPSFVLLALMCSMANGPYQAWGASLPTVWSHLKFSRSQTDLLSLGSLAAYSAGCYVFGEIGDRMFRGRFKELLLLFLLGAFLSFGWLCLMLPMPWSTQPVVSAGFGSILLAASLTGWFTGATNPICMELAAEITYPTPEGISGNIIVFAAQVCTILFLAVTPSMDSLVTTPLMGAIILACAVLILPVKARYLRSLAEGSL